MDLTAQEIQLIIALINVAPIKGSEALMVSNLRIKLNTLLKPSEKKPTESPQEDKKENKK